MTSKIYSAIPYGFSGKIVEVEGDIAKSLPNFNIVGMADKTINEAKERVRSALINSGFSFPDKKVTISLAPADLQKDGPFLDLPIALSVLVLSGQLLNSNLKNRLFVGELSLSGNLRPVKGIINILETAKEYHIEEVFVPLSNLPQCSLIAGLKIYGVDTLTNLFLHLKGQSSLKTAVEAQNSPNLASLNKTQSNYHLSSETPLLDHVRSQVAAKRALTIAIAGHHNILLSGPPGAGKTFLAKIAPNLLPVLTSEEKIEITKIYSLANLITDEIIETRPFRAPHHSASAVSILGGGPHATPGEISLAHKGILFLDEIPEFPRSVLETLRQPLEDKTIAISRADRKVIYPADFMLIATMNPCPCGYYGDETHECSCSLAQIQAYQKKLSGPLLDRIDLYVNVEKVKNSDLLANLSNSSTSEHNVVKNTITDAIVQQFARYKKSGFYNSSLSSFEVTKFFNLSPAVSSLLKSASETLNLSARSYFKTLKVARTIADLECSTEITPAHLAEALTYRYRPLF